jgi:hypothetical protein
MYGAAKNPTTIAELKHGIMSTANAHHHISLGSPAFIPITSIEIRYAAANA